jgi:hypothetical protein
MIIPEIIKSAAATGIPLDKMRNPRIIPANASSEIRIRLVYQIAGILRVIFQIGPSVRRIPIGPLKITIDKRAATKAASDSISIYY